MSSPIPTWPLSKLATERKRAAASLPCSAGGAERSILLLTLWASALQTEELLASRISSSCVIKKPRRRTSPTNSRSESPSRLSRSLNHTAGARLLPSDGLGGFRARKSFSLTPSTAESSGIAKSGICFLLSIHSRNCSMGTRTRPAQNSGLSRAASIISLSISLAEYSRRNPTHRRRIEPNDPSPFLPSRTPLSLNIRQFLLESLAEEMFGPLQQAPRLGPGCGGIHFT